MKKYRIWLMAVALAILCASPSIAGSTYMLVCRNKACKFESDVDFGGGFEFELITGYCTKCQEFVYIRWKRGEKPKKPVSYVWDEFIGVYRPLYKCPKCRNPFLAIKSADNIKHCPKCGKGPPVMIRHTLYD